MLTKIRILLLILTLTLVGTAMTIHFTITDEDMLELDASKLTNKIHQFENKIDEVWADSLSIKTFQNVEKYPLQVAELTSKLKKDFVLIYIYKHHELVHWSDNNYVPATDLGLKNKISFLETTNRSFLVQKRELKNNIAVVALVPLKRDFEASNEYLNDDFISNINVKNIDIAKYDDNTNIRNIYSRANDYLFSIKLIDGKKDNVYINLQFFCWLMALICTLIVSNSICIHIAKQGRGWLAALLFLSVIFFVRYVDLKTNWLSIHSSLELFDPKYYAYNEFLPNLWSYIMTTAMIFWYICFLRTIQNSLRIPYIFHDKIWSTIISLIAILSIYVAGFVMYHYLGTLLTHSSFYENDFTKILNLGAYGWLTIVILCFNITSLVLYVDSTAQLVKFFSKEITTLLNIQLICVVISLIACTLLDLNLLFCVLFGVLILLRTYRTYPFAKPYMLSIFIVSVFLLSSISVVSYDFYNTIRKTESMKLAINQLLAEDDTNAVSLFIDLEKDLRKDEQLKRLLNHSDSSSNRKAIDEYIRTRYLSGYLSKFEFQAFAYNNEGHPLNNYGTDKANEYREKVIKNAIKIPYTNNFYRLKSDLGSLEYFTSITIPYVNNPNKVYHLYLNLKNLSFGTPIPYPDILSDNRVINKQFDQFQENSYAFYRDGELVTQFGSFNYPSLDKYKGKKTHQFTKVSDNSDFIHLLYKPDAQTTVVYSKLKPSLWDVLALGSIVFIFLLCFFSVFNLFNYIIRTFANTQFRWKRIRYHFWQVSNSILYSTRIQSLVIISVLIGILLSGTIAFVSINRQLERNQSNNRQREIAEITRKIESTIAIGKEIRENTMVDLLKDVSVSSISNFNLFDKHGKLLFSTQPRIYDMKFVSDYINPDVLTKLGALRKTIAYEDEEISDFSYASAYTPIKDAEFKTVAYLNIPYYDTVKEAAASKKLLLNTILNIYTVVIILFGFIAVAVSSKITEPLNIVKQKLAETQLSNKINEPLYWERNDEIGMLIKEYNYMLIKLEDSAKQLRDAERENAWREMAKQVAHEIKNPLTPMKLGVQQLMRSYNENDPKFAERFQRISLSIIEQIDSLSTIATEFSAFAKLPETNLMKLDIIEKINKTVILFSNGTNVSISVMNHTEQPHLYILGDRDQFLRSLNNLFKNAIEASRGKKKHTINVSIEQQSDRSIRLSIQDNGYGIPPEVIPSIFKPNFTTKSSGTGLGLAFVKQTITGIGGSISFITKPGTGTTFIINLPEYQA